MGSDRFTCCDCETWEPFPKVWYFMTSKAFGQAFDTYVVLVGRALIKKWPSLMGWQIDMNPLPDIYIDDTWWWCRYPAIHHLGCINKTHIKYWDFNLPTSPGATAEFQPPTVQMVTAWMLEWCFYQVIRPIYNVVFEEWWHGRSQELGKRTMTTCCYYG